MPTRNEGQCRIVVRTSITISEESKKKAEEIKNALPFLKSFGAVVEYCITRVYEEEANPSRKPKQ